MLFRSVRDELTRDFYELDPNISITACPTLIYIANTFKVEAKAKGANQVLHSSHVELEPISSTPQIKKIIEDAGFSYKFTENIETEKLPLKKLLKMYQNCDYVVTTRLHGAIIAYAFKRPYIAISFDPKIAAFNQLYGGGVCISNVDQLHSLINSDKFKVGSNYEAELVRIRDFGKLVAKSIL